MKQPRLSTGAGDNFNAGFFLRDGTWRPSATAVQTMTRLIPAPRLESIVSDGKDAPAPVTIQVPVVKDDLDLAHAQISARNMQRGDPRGYLAQLPLATVREVHINHPFDDGMQMLDRHLPIGPGDLDLLQWTLARTPRAEAITLESHGPSEDALLGEIALLRGLLGRT